ncbi:hypothetical protein [Candidatus Kuenenia stuttgartiensis]|uniref:hypothetical protein n=1 Tax=Kuenenia stuttgartiensis TaxID=174633 RepID=UPI00146B65ED|nr:hypothetical protein [Candidatus Kuenenia stuttgartiensis]
MLCQRKNLKKSSKHWNVLWKKDSNEAWSVWEELGKNAAEGKWNDASERHYFCLYGIKK